MWNTVYPKILTRLTQLNCSLKNRSRFHILDELLKEQWLHREAIEDLQMRRLQRLLTEANRSCPYYQDLFRVHRIDVRDIRSLSDLRHIPPLTRADLQQHVAGILSTPAQNYYRNASGGSTGEPVVVFQDSNYREYGEALYLLFLSWAGVAIGDKTAVFWGSDRDLASISRRDSLVGRIYRMRILNSFNSSERELDDFLRDLAVWLPQFIYGYASSLDNAARRALEMNIRSISPRAVRSSAELLSAPQRRRIQAAFGAPVLDFYGSREINNIAAQCLAQEGLHVMAPGRIVEIERDEHAEGESDGMGQLIVTDLTNFTFPLIRYKNGDRGTLDSSPCPCGRQWPSLRKLGGRTSDTLHLGGRSVHGEFFTHLFYDFDNVRQFQVIQDGPAHLKILIKAKPAFTEYGQLRTRIGDHIGGPVQIDFVDVGEIQPTSSGKQKFVINEWDGERR